MWHNAVKRAKFHDADGFWIVKTNEQNSDR